MRAFEYTSPTTKQQVIELLGGAWGETEILAGGTDLLDLMKEDLITPKRLVNIKDIKELHGIQATKSGLRIGAAVKIEDLVESPYVRQHYQVIADAAREIASPQIRHMATVGGNLCQRPRCWYFRSGWGLLAQDKDGKSLVLQGDNRYHAILGNSGPAYFVHPSSLAPALIACEARLQIFGPKGSREVALEKFYRAPASSDQREHTLEPNEMVAEVLVPSIAGTKSAFYEVRQKDAFDWPLALAAVVLKVNAGKVQLARVVMGHVAPTPWRSSEAEQALVGKALSEEAAQAAGNAAVENARDLGRNGYKIQLARVAVKRAVLQAAKAGA
ncbi:MAG TPA: xanthine dehydrogenase family protein subunit M [Acidobacteriota bacterium]|nr:xanthine dehydrogenase family protein subunit M [Acidobacteriota bacterium]